MKYTLPVAMLLGLASAATLKAKAGSKAAAEEYLRQVYAQVGEVYEPGLAQSERRARRTIARGEYKNYHNLYPPTTGAVAKLRGEPWPCTLDEPCGEAQGTCFNPQEMYVHPDYFCEEGLWCQTRHGGARGGPGEEVHGVVFTGALKQHHVGANDICFDPDWNGDEGTQKRAVLRRKFHPCTHDDPCGAGEGDCQNDEKNCASGLSCAAREEIVAHGEPGEPVHGIEFTGDILQNDNNAPDLCYNPHWPKSDPHYEGRLVRSCDTGLKNCEAEVYLVIGGERKHVPNPETLHLVFGPHPTIIQKPEDAFKDIPKVGALCSHQPVVKGADHDSHFIFVDGYRRQILNEATSKHMQINGDGILTLPQCTMDHFADLGPVVDYSTYEHISNQ